MADPLRTFAPDRGRARYSMQSHSKDAEARQDRLQALCIGPRAARPAFAIIAALTLATGRTAVAISAEHELAQQAGDGDVPVFLAWFGIVGVVCLIGAILFGRLGAAIWRRQKAHAEAGAGDATAAASPLPVELSVAGCVAVSATIVTAALAIAIATSIGFAIPMGLRATSAEAGPLEWTQIVVWLAAAGLAVFAAARSRDLNVRSLLALLAIGAVLAAAREADLHEKLNPDTLGVWGLHYRGDWWLDANSPLMPRIVWAAAALVAVVVGGYLAWRGAGAVFTRGSRHGRLIWVLVAAAVLLFLGYILDDLLRYRRGINLRQSQVAEETLELAACLVYLAGIVWAIRLLRLPPPVQPGR